MFQPYRAGAMLWSYVDVDALEPDEVVSLVTDAWAMVAPKKVTRAYLSGGTRKSDD